MSDRLDGTNKFMSGSDDMGDPVAALEDCDEAGVGRDGGIDENYASWKTFCAVLLRQWRGLRSRE